MPQHPIRDAHRLTDGFGRRKKPDGKWDMHLGQDYACEMRTPVYPLSPGTVVDVGEDHRIYGNYVVVKHDDGYSSLYAHFFTDAYVHENQKVQLETWLGGVGDTGLSFGDHLHLGVSRGILTVTNSGVRGDMVDPLSYITQTSVNEASIFKPKIEDNDMRAIHLNGVPNSGIIIQAATPPYSHPDNVFQALCGAYGLTSRGLEDWQYGTVVREQWTAARQANSLATPNVDLDDDDVEEIARKVREGLTLTATVTGR